MISAFLFASCLYLTDESSKQTLLDLRESYSKLDSMRVSIEHDFSSGLFPGKYVDDLLISKEHGFRLLVRPGSDGKRPEKSSMDYYCVKNQVTVIRNDGERMTLPLNTDANTLPGYEVSGSFLLSWMLKSPAYDLLMKPPQGYRFEYSWGSRNEWHDVKVKEIIVKAIQEKATDGQPISLFTSEDKRKLVGMEWRIGDKTGFLLYKDQKDNPEVKASDFQPPK